MTALKAQGTDLFILYDGALTKVGCITSFTPGDDAADQLETTCLAERQSRTYVSGLANPAQASISLNFDPEDPSHLLLWNMKQDLNGEGVFAIGMSDGTAAPTIAATGATDAVNGLELPTTRSWYTFTGEVAGYAPDFQQNALVTATVTITRSGAPTLTLKEPVTP